MPRLQQVPKAWARLVKNRAFVAELVANPENALRKYNIRMDEDRLLRMGEIVDKLFDHASKTLAEPSPALLHCSQACL